MLTKKIIIPAYKGSPMSVRDRIGTVIALDQIGEEFFYWVKVEEPNNVRLDVDIPHHVTINAKNIERLINE